MNVDVQNFSQIRQLIFKQQLIQKSELISFDLQFAGLKFQGNDRDRSQYMPAQKYQKMSTVARKYSIMQVGITFFIPCQNSELITAYPFNFYVFPRPTMYGEPTISLQSGCVSFNINNKMDWNKWIEKGITYMKLTQYERINEIIQKGKKYEDLLQLLDQQNKIIVKQIIEQIQRLQKQGKSDIQQQGKWYEVPLSGYMFTKKVIEKYFEQKNKLYIVKSSEDMVLDFKNKQQETIEFQIVKITIQQKENSQRRKNEDLFGFTLLFQKIWNSGKAFAGHNCFFDILFMYEAFIAALPYDYQLFKKIITQLKINKELAQTSSEKRIFYDTKLISNNLNFSNQYFEDSTSLQAIYNAFFSNNLIKKKIILPKQYQRYDLKNQVLHEAGFDSYLTGWIYYQMLELGKVQSLDVKLQFKGKVNLNRSYFYINFNEAFDGVCPYRRVFYIQVAEPKKYVTIQIIKKKRSQIVKIVKQIVKEENIVKDVIIHEGLKQVFIQIKEKKNFEKITCILVKNIKQKRIKDVYGLNNFLNAKCAKQWTDSFSKNNVNA